MYFTSKTFTSNGTWTAPAGVTQVFISNNLSSGSYFGGMSSGGIALSVTPNTTYAITASTSVGPTQNSCSFGGLYQAKGPATLTVMWIE